ncbi:bifunctional aspartate transaminase/aspartate 4-decarboxylase [Psychroserpens sp. NJDZ02]|uniref:bifunctional aspartate transaminase/aspartate 4-decarboxylase n=1 Tax=Psychroserpens sp. NJDZ02 TaxID=2570561 RepID=UPI0010A85CA7|nr:bifunctional aspartate transaminase/aspartate 4-decarboxylase [Psychroserpens sp. NJDZ02]QCE42936.1 bifunctional aspartate transaminase/aspartate 4-decarboxylase [Psychroserpens sp. NJDZ02]
MKKQEEVELNTLSPFEVKDTLIKLAKSNHQHSMINAGRGNPNWIATKPRDAFFQLGLFGLEESKRQFQELDGFGGITDKDGITKRFQAYLALNKNVIGLRYLNDLFQFAVANYGIDSDDLMFEWVNGIIGNNYPEPGRMLKHSETIAHAYLMKEMSAGATPPESKYDVFATEGGTAAMVYIFNSLKANKFLKAGDTIAIGTPIFTPYFEMPALKDYDLKMVLINSDENDNWQIPDSEIDKLKDTKVKAFFLVNPSNPPSVKLSETTLDKIAKIAKDREDLILLTDDVYGSFTENFTSLAIKAPESTILVYSYSKYFGATGWRLGVIALNENNNFDKMLAKLPEEDKVELRERYGTISLNPDGIKMIDRFVADSRSVALNHTAGLSTPQQIQMSLFSLATLIDTENKYKKDVKKLVRNRYDKLYKDLPGKPLISEDNKNAAYYYTLVDFLNLARDKYNEAFSKWVGENYNALDPVIRLAEEESIVAMPGGGFDGPDWTIRFSLANSYSEDFEKISILINDILDEYYNEFQKI